MNGCSLLAAHPLCNGRTDRNTGAAHGHTVRSRTVPTHSWRSPWL